MMRTIQRGQECVDIVDAWNRGDKRPLHQKYGTNQDEGVLGMCEASIQHMERTMERAIVGDN